MFASLNVRATELEIFDGLAVQSQNRFPSLEHDLMAVNQLAGSLLSAGFYYKTFMGPAIGPVEKHSLLDVLRTVYPARRGAWKSRHRR